MNEALTSIEPARALFARYPCLSLEDQLQRPLFWRDVQENEESISHRKNGALEQTNVLLAVRVK
jgi:hypothetical protein